MPKLAANWPYLLVSQIARGKFFLKPEIALSMGPHVARILAGEAAAAQDEITERSIEILTIDESGKIKQLFSESGKDPNDQMSQMYDEAPAGSVAIIPVKGTMLKYGTMCEYGTAELADFVLTAARHKNIAAIVLDHDSGGGSVDAVAPMVQAIREVKKLKKPIVASVDMACSAAYWIASETDWIVLDNDISAEVGSIGVMMSFYDVKPMYEEMGVKFHTIYADESKDKNLAWELALKGEYDLIKEDSLNPLARNFQAAVRANRKGRLKADTPGILSGKTFYASEAEAYGLVDQIGTRNTAIQVALSMSHARKFI